MHTNILLIDDDEDEHVFFDHSMREAGMEYKLWNAYNAREAKAILTASVPDVIFLDVNMPEMDGFACIDMIRQLPGCSGIPLFLYSTLITEELAVKARAHGADGAIVKKHKHSDLTTAMERALQQKNGNFFLVL